MTKAEVKVVDPDKLTRQGEPRVVGRRTVDARGVSGRSSRGQFNDVAGAILVATHGRASTDEVVITNPQSVSTVPRRGGPWVSRHVDVVVGRVGPGESKEFPFETNHGRRVIIVKHHK